MSVQLNEAYRDWQPSRQARSTVRNLIAAVPERYLIGLGAVVLTNHGALTHDRKRAKTWSRQRKVSFARCLGLYHRGRDSQRAWIEIFVDHVEARWPRPMQRVPFFRHLLFADTLYHELGHHIHATQAPEYREQEDVADKWRDQLVKGLFRKRYWYLVPVLRLSSPVIKWAKIFVQWRISRSKGRLSQRSG